MDMHSQKEQEAMDGDHRHGLQQPEVVNYSGDPILMCAGRNVLVAILQSSFEANFDCGLLLILS